MTDQMEVREITDKQELNSFVVTALGGQFLQSFEWGEFQKVMGNRFWRFGVGQPGNILAVAAVIEHQLPFAWSYIYTPHGPVFKENLADAQKEEIIRLFLSKARDLTVKTKYRQEVFFRLEPRLNREDLGNFWFNLGFIKTQAVQPQDTLVLDLSMSEEELLNGMHHKTRYNIRLAVKHGVIIREAQAEADLEIFWRLMTATAKRDDFHSHPHDYYLNLWKSFADTDINNQLDLTIKLLIAQKGNEPLAAGLFSFFGDRAVYLHGASADSRRELMAPYLLQWQAIKIAKLAGYQIFDFWGITPAKRKIKANEKVNKWQGITRFKKGFGGREVNFVGAWDWVYNKLWYKFYRLGKRFL